MTDRRRANGLLWPTIATLIVFVILLSLGAWQWQRMHWKQALLAELADRSAAAPVNLDVLTAGQSSDQSANLDHLRFRRVTVRGTFEHNHEMHVWHPTPAGPAWSIITPLRLDPTRANETTPAGNRASHVLVIRGIVPDALKPPQKRSGAQATGAQLVTGRVRLDDPNTWANEPNIERNQWFTRDLAVMARHLASEFSSPVQFAPFFIEAEHPIGGANAPQPQLKSLTLTNRHLEYALTWWGLAATLIAVFAAFVRSRLRAT